MWKVWSKYVFICFLLALILWQNWIIILHSSSLRLSWLSCFHRVMSFISWGVLVCTASPCWLSRWFLLLTFLCSFPQSTIFIRRWWESNLHVWQFSILFKRMPNILVPVWAASAWYCLRSIDYNSKISFQKGGSRCFTAHHWRLSGFFSPHYLPLLKQNLFCFLLVIFFFFYIRNLLQWFSISYSFHPSYHFLHIQSLYR